MRRILLFSAAALAGYATAAGAQNPPPAQQPMRRAAPAGIKLSAVAGTWEARSMMGPKDSVIATYTLTATADGKGWTIKFPTRDPIPTRVVATGGDSIVTEAGPYPSILRPGQTVTLLRTIAHFKGDTMTGTFSARYASGDTVQGKTVATRKK